MLLTIAAHTPIHTTCVTNRPFCVQQASHDVTDITRMCSWTLIYLIGASMQSEFFRRFFSLTTHNLWRPHFSAICVDFINISIRTVDISFRRVETSNPKVWMDTMLYKITISIAPLLACF